MLSPPALEIVKRRMKVIWWIQFKIAIFHIVFTILVKLFKPFIIWEMTQSRIPKSQVSN